MSVTNIPKSTWDALNNKCKTEGGKLFSSADICKPGETLPISSVRVSGDAWLAVSDNTNEWIQIGVDKSPHPPCLSHTQNFGPPQWGMSGTLDSTYYACNIPVTAAPPTSQTTTQSAPTSPASGTPVPPIGPSQEDIQKERLAREKAEKDALDRAKAEKDAADKAKAEKEADKKRETTRGWGLTIGILLLISLICCCIMVPILYFSSGLISDMIFGAAVYEGSKIVRKGISDTAGVLNKGLEYLTKKK